MRRVLITITTAIAMLVASSGAASADPPEDPRASCVAVITSYEASQLPPGSVGREVSELASSSPGLGSALVSPLAHEHGSIDTCRPDEG